MPWLAGTCPNCGSVLKVDSSKDAAICEHCGTPFVTEKAINIYNNPTIYAENVILNNSSDDFEIVAGKLMKYKGASTVVHVPEGVINIDPHVFQGGKNSAENITELYLPSTLREPVYLEGCKDLKKVVFSENFSGNVGNFSKCTSLKEINIPKNCNSVGCFRESSIESVTIPANSFIGFNAFCYCSKLSTVNISFPVKMECIQRIKDPHPDKYYHEDTNKTDQLTIHDINEFYDAIGSGTPYTQTPFDHTPYMIKVRSSGYVSRLMNSYTKPDSITDKIKSFLSFGK